MKNRPSAPVPQEKIKSPNKSEREFINLIKAQEKLENKSGVKIRGRATGSGNGGNPVAFEFSTLRTEAFKACHVPERIGKFAPKNWIDPLSVKVAAVNFNLCLDDSSACNFEESLPAKALPELNIILVNVNRWQQSSAGIKVTTALRASLEIMGLVNSDLGLPNQIRLQTVQSGSRPNFIITTHCLEDN